MTLDNMTGITEGSYTGFCKSQLITCNRVKECNGVCPFEDALKHADKEMDEQHTVDHDRDWIIGCIQHDGFIHTHRFDKANQIILDALSAETLQGWIPCSERLPEDIRPVLVTWKNTDPASYYQYIVGKHFTGTACYKNGKWYWYSSTTEDMLAEYGRYDSEEFDEAIECIAWMPLPKPYKGGDEE